MKTRAFCRCRGCQARIAAQALDIARDARNSRGCNGPDWLVVGGPIIAVRLQQNFFA